ncbi:MAG: peptide chain release factor N(5)-glutamine methyltransferase [Halioglobus sp.]|nr:peptide chain release factor N(5)-glutamine methyltransferase [Halioglobus sp.]
MRTVQELLRSGEKLPTESARRDAEVLLSHCLGKPRSWLYAYPEQTVSDACAVRYDVLLAQRSEGQPVAYLTGEREFWSLRLSVSSATLIPRPETELLVHWALDLTLHTKARVLDLGTGCGAIALAVASERPAWRVTGVDISEAALRVARRNGRRVSQRRVSFAQSDWYSNLDGRYFDLLLANPPYIDPCDKHLVRGDVRFEPRGALVSAQQGLADLQQLVAGAPVHLGSGGWLLLEHGCEQGETVRRLLRQSGFSAVNTRRDLAGHERVTGGCWHAE